MGKKNVYFKIILNYLIALLLLLFILFLLPRLIGFFWPFIVGWFIAMIANPLVRFMEKRIKIVRKHSSAIIIILVLTIITGLLYLIASTIIQQVSSFIDNLPVTFNNIQKEIGLFRERINDIGFLPYDVREYVDNIITNIGDVIGESINNLKNFVSIRSAGILVKNVAEGLLMTIIVILSSYFFIAERDNLMRWVANKSSKDLKKQYHLIVHNFTSAAGGYFKAQLKIAVVIFLIVLVGLFLLGLDYAVLLALLIAFMDFLPIFGAGTILWPWAIFDVITGNYMQAISLMVIYVVCLIVRQVIQPKMVADSIGLSPLATLFYMFVGYRLGGVTGMIIGIPIGMILTNFYKSGIFDDLIKGFKIITKDINNFRKM